MLKTQLSRTECCTETLLFTTFITKLVYHIKKKKLRETVVLNGKMVFLIVR